MAFKPQNANRPQGGDFENTRDLPTPRSGSRKARIALIVDLGVQEREDFEDPNTGEFKPQKPCQQVAVFADLVADTVDYGGKIGKQHYRMALNKSFMGKVVGINFAATPPKDAKGNTINGKPWGLHPANVLSKIAKAVGKPEVIESMDISELLDEAFMCQVEVKETPDKNGKKDKDGELIVYKNVNFKGAAPIPEDDDGEPLPVADLNVKALCITFDDAKAADIQYIRAGLIKQIKLANNYAGSQMQKAIEAYEATLGGDAGEEEEQEAPAPKAKPAAKAPAKPKAKPASAPQETEEEDVPF